MEAVIDLGTNTFHLLIAEVKYGMINEYFKLQIPVKLGAGGINNGFIIPEAFERGMNALGEFRKHLDTFNVQQVKAVATSAIRNAANGRDFISKAESLHGIKIKAISGEKEAVCIYEGVRNSLSLPHDTVLVMDIGGGSIEFIIGRGPDILWKQSFELGAARLIEKFQQHDPLTPGEIVAVHNYLREQLLPLRQALAITNSGILIGSAGSFETLLDVIWKDFGVVPHTLSRHAFEISLQDFDRFANLMVTSTSDQRLKLKGMIDFRVEMIVVASIAMNYVIRECNMKRIIISEYALKEGLLFSSEPL